MNERTERQDLKIKETATLEKFEMTEHGRELVETITIENGVIVSRESPPH